jgi:hypothetical protein
VEEAFGLRNLPEAIYVSASATVEKLAEIQDTGAVADGT